MRNLAPFTFAVAATFTADPIAIPLTQWSKVLGVEVRAEFAPFGQVLQSLLDPGSLLRRNEHGVNVIFFRYKDLGEKERREENLESLLAALKAVPLGKCPYFVVACPEEETQESSRMKRSLEGTANVYFLAPEWIDKRYPVEKKFNPEAEKLGAIPYSEDYFAALAASLVRAAHAHQHPAAKVLVLDCDQTLWAGVCGEDGPDGVRLTPGHEALQRYAVEQRAEGTLIALASKNNLNDVEATFAAHPEFPLRWEHITAHRVNWQPKPDNLRELARELSLGLDSFVFLDDSPKEISEVNKETAEVIAIQIPAHPEELQRFVWHLWPFDRLRVTEADRGRAASYEQAQEFGKAREEAGSLKDFYRNLELQVSVRGVESGDFERAAQLTQRTNQFNLSTIRRSEADLRQLWEERWEIFRIEVKDRFGNYGFTGLLMGRADHGEYRVDTFLLSCRVLGRGVEHAVMRWLAKHAERLGLKSVLLPFESTAKNQPAAEFLQELGAVSLPFQVSTEELAEAKLTERSRSKSETKLATEEKPKPSKRLDYAEIAAQWNRVSAFRYQGAQEAEEWKFATDTEVELAKLWRELLPEAEVEASSNFFELGGHSLLAVLLLSKISEAFAVELGIDEAYSIDMTLEKMARRIDEAKAFAGLDKREYQLLYAEIEKLSDEEVEAALAREFPEEMSENDARTISL